MDRRLAGLKNTMLTTVDEIAEQCGMMGITLLLGREVDPQPDKVHDLLSMV